MDGVRCKFGASHMSLEASRAAFRSSQPKQARAKLAPKRERLDGKPKRQREFLF